MWVTTVVRLATGQEYNTKSVSGPGKKTKDLPPKKNI
jgi:hypothetical protein